MAADRVLGVGVGADQYGDTIFHAEPGDGFAVLIASGADYKGVGVDLD